MPCLILDNATAVQGPPAVQASKKAVRKARHVDDDDDDGDKGIMSVCGGVERCYSNVNCIIIIIIDRETG